MPNLVTIEGTSVLDLIENIAVLLSGKLCNNIKVVIIL